MKEIIDFAVEAIYKEIMVDDISSIDWIELVPKVIERL